MYGTCLSLVQAKLNAERILLTNNQCALLVQLLHKKIRFCSHVNYELVFTQLQQRVMNNIHYLSHLYRSTIRWNAILASVMVHAWFARDGSSLALGSDMIADRTCTKMLCINKRVEERSISMLGIDQSLTKQMMH